VEEVGAAHAKLFFQMYWVGSRETILARAERARAAGAKGLIMTLDWSFASRRDWGSPPIPEKIDLKNAVKFAPEVLRKPRWLATYLRSGGIPLAEQTADVEPSRDGVAQAVVEAGQQGDRPHYQPLSSGWPLIPASGQHQGSQGSRPQHPQAGDPNPSPEAKPQVVHPKTDPEQPRAVRASPQQPRQITHAFSLHPTALESPIPGAESPRSAALIGGSRPTFYK